MSARRLAILAAITLGLGSSAAFAATMNVGSWHMWAGSQTLTKGTCTLTGTTSTVDTYVDEKSQASSFGGATTLSVGGKSGSRTWSFVRFDLSSCNIPATGGADSATLSLRVITAPSSSQSIDVSPVTATWDGTLTWTAAQLLTYGATTTTFATGTANNTTKTATVTADVDALIRNSSSSFGWRLSQIGTTNVFTILGSTQNGTATNRPQLQINYEK